MEKEAMGILEIWGDAEVQCQSVQTTRANTHIYIAMSEHMREHNHQHSGCQCCVKVKALRAQWV